MDASYNDNNAPFGGKPDPTDDFVGLGLQVSGPLQVQVNTAQFGRTFQDRSHTFKIKKRPADVSDSARIVNYNVRGRRGNIVQVYPSVEYDFVPPDLTVETGDYLHFQWTGSDANNQGNAGNGRDGTDRSNLVQIGNRGGNKPLPIENHTLFFDGVNDPDGEEAAKGKELVAKFAYLDQKKHAADAGNTCDDDSNNDDADDNCKQLNAAPAYFDGGLVEMKVLGTHHVASTRNNDYTNRSQKASITVTQRALRATEVAFIMVGVLAASVIAYHTAAAVYALQNPASKNFSEKRRPCCLRLPCCRPCVRRKEGERQRLKEKNQQKWQRKIAVQASYLDDFDSPMQRAAKGDKRQRRRKNTSQPEEDDESTRERNDGKA